jgi:hypothetical protein
MSANARDINDGAAKILDSCSKIGATLKAMSEQHADLNARLAQLEASVRTIPLSDGFRAEYIRYQAEADSVLRAFHDSAPAPMAGERLPDYRARLLEPLRRYSPTCKDVDLSRVHDPRGFDNIASQILADARREAERPTAVSLPSDGRMIERFDTDISGRRIRKVFSSNPGACWNQFKRLTQFVKGWANPKTGQIDKVF